MVSAVVIYERMEVLVGFLIWLEHIDNVFLRIMSLGDTSLLFGTEYGLRC
jgi:hypothetical protein